MLSTGVFFYARPSLFNSKRREVQREIIQASLGDIGGEHHVVTIQPSSLNRVSDSRNSGRHTIRLMVTTINAITTVERRSS
jgi:hypothetical protein